MTEGEFLIRGRIELLQKKRKEIELRITRHENQEEAKKTNLKIKLALVFLGAFIASCYFLGKIELWDDRIGLLFSLLIVIGLVIPLIVVFTRDLQNYATSRLDYERDVEEYQRLYGQQKELEEKLTEMLKMQSLRTDPEQEQ